MESLARLARSLPMTRPCLLVLLTVMLVGARTSAAGVCLSDREADDDMKLVEAYAKDRSKREEVVQSYAFFCVGGAGKRLKARIAKACLAIMKRDGETTECMTAAATAGLSMLGDHDVFAWIAKQDEDPLFDHTRLTLFNVLGDPRAVAITIEEWRATLPRAAAREKRKGSMAGWSSWRQVAAMLIGAHGGKDELAFLDEQAAATKDKYVALECRTAIAAIERRLAAASTAAPP